MSLSALRSLFAAFSSLLFLVPTFPVARSSEYFPSPDSAGGWRTAKDAVQVRKLAGMDLPRLEQAWEFTQRCTQNGGLLVVRRSYLVFEKYFGRASRNANPDMASTGKAYTSIACGIMLREFRHKIPEGLDTKVFTDAFLPEAFPLDDARRADITLGQLLCMTGGYNGEGQSPTAVVLGKAFPLKAVPGQNIRDLDMSSLRCAMWTNAGAGYSYSSPEPHIASMVLRRVTGMELQDYINERLAKLMGWGTWGYCLHRGDFTMPHANGDKNVHLAVIVFSVFLPAPLATKSRDGCRMARHALRFRGQDTEPWPSRSSGTSARTVRFRLCRSSRPASGISWVRR